LIPWHLEGKRVQPVVDYNGGMPKERQVLENGDRRRVFPRGRRRRWHIRTAAIEETNFDAFEEVKSATGSCKKGFSRVVGAKRQRKAFSPSRSRENHIFQHVDLRLARISRVSVLR